MLPFISRLSGVVFALFHPTEQCMTRQTIIDSTPETIDYFSLQRSFFLGLIDRIFEDVKRNKGCCFCFEVSKFHSSLSFEK